MIEKMKRFASSTTQNPRNMSWKDKGARRAVFITGAVVILLLAAGTGFFIFRRTQTDKAATTNDTYQTATARRGTLTISASGSGSLVGGNSTSLAFPIAGVVKKLHVNTGEEVKAGQVLAELEDTRTLIAAVTEAEGKLAAAQKAKDDLLASADGNLAAARLALVTAQINLNDAKNKVLTWVSHRGSDSMIDSADSALAMAKLNLDKAQEFFDRFKSKALTDPDRVEALSRLVSAQTAYNQAKYTLDYLESKPTNLEVQKNDQNLAIAQAAVTKAESDLKFLEDNKGINPADLGTAESNLALAQVALKKARENLANATLRAPFDGTVLSIAGKEGDSVSTDTYIVVADLQHPDIDFSYDETDMDKVAVGNSAQVVFDAIPDNTYKATVTSVSPSLASQGGYSVLTGIAKLESLNTSSIHKFVEGMTASIEVINAESKDAILVPVEAIHNIGDGQYAVFVVGNDGSLTLTVVEVGLNDGTYAEIKSGLIAGQTISTGVMETQR
jgi:HlyD family secretion protein